MLKLKKVIEAETFLYEPTKIYKINSISELKGLANKFPLRILDGENVFVWKAEDLDHSSARRILKPYISDIDNYEGFMLENNCLLNGMLKHGEQSLKKFSKKFFKKIEKNGLGDYSFEWK